MGDYMESLKTVVVKKHKPTDDTQLELEVGEIVYVLEQDETGWWGGHKEGEERTGWFPGSCVRTVEAVPGLAEVEKRLSTEPEKRLSTEGEQAKKAVKEVPSPVRIKAERAEKVEPAPTPKPTSGALNPHPQVPSPLPVGTSSQNSQRVEPLPTPEPSSRALYQQVPSPAGTSSQKVETIPTPKPGSGALYQQVPSPVGTSSQRVEPLPTPKPGSGALGSVREVEPVPTPKPGSGSLAASRNVTSERPADEEPPTGCVRDMVSMWQKKAVATQETVATRAPIDIQSVASLPKALGSIVGKSSSADGSRFTPLLALSTADKTILHEVGSFGMSPISRWR